MTRETLSLHEVTVAPLDNIHAKWLQKSGCPKREIN